MRLAPSAGVESPPDVRQGPSAPSDRQCQCPQRSVSVVEVIEVVENVALKRLEVVDVHHASR